MTDAPQHRRLTRDESVDLLGRNHVGRIAYASGSHIDIEPIYYVYSDGWVYGRTSPGRKLDMIGTGWWPVAFEVDEVDSRLGWRSVVVQGGFYTLDPVGSAWERMEAAKAAALLRSIVPGVASVLDSRDEPATVLFRIAVQEVSGRAHSLSEEVSMRRPSAIAEAGVSPA